MRNQLAQRDLLERLTEMYNDRYIINYLSANFTGIPPADIEDLASDAFYYVYRKIDSLEDEKHLSQTLYMVSRHKAIDFKKSMEKNRVFFCEKEMEGGIEYNYLNCCNESEPLNCVIMGEFKEEMYTLVMSLPEKYKEAIVLYYGHDCSCKQIEEITGVPTTTVRTRVHRGKKMLRSLAEERGVSLCR